jgi:hypothetical protein
VRAASFIAIISIATALACRSPEGSGASGEQAKSDADTKAAAPGKPGMKDLNAASLPPLP